MIEMIPIARLVEQPPRREGKRGGSRVDPPKNDAPASDNVEQRLRDWQRGGKGLVARRPIKTRPTYIGGRALRLSGRRRLAILAHKVGTNGQTPQGEVGRKKGKGGDSLAHQARSGAQGPLDS